MFSYFIHLSCIVCVCVCVCVCACMCVFLTVIHQFIYIVDMTNRVIVEPDTQ